MMITAPNDPSAFAVVYTCMRVGSCVWGLAGSAVGPCGSDWSRALKISVSFSFFALIVGLLPLVVASFVWRDLCCLLTWWLLAQLCLCVDWRSGLARTPDPPLRLALLCCAERILFIILFCGVSNYLLPCFSGILCVMEISIGLYAAEIFNPGVTRVDGLS